MTRAYMEKLKILEKRVEEKEAAIKKREADLKKDMIRFEEHSKSQAIEWLDPKVKEV